MGYNVLSMQSVLTRILAKFAASALGVVGAGALAGVELWKAALMAGIGGVASVVESLAQAYLKDGVLDAKEINESFSDPN
jgi:hypothetical protein